MEKFLSISNRNGKKLDAILNTPNEPTKSIVIIVNHSGYESDSHYVPNYCATALPLYGYAVLRFNFYGLGSSSMEFEKLSITSMVNDLKDVMAFAKSNNYTEISLLGPSLGAAVALLAYDESIKTMMFLSPLFDFSLFYKRYAKQFENGQYAELHRGDKVLKMGRQFWEESGKLKLDTTIESVKCPVLVICAGKDTIVPNSSIKKEYSKFNHKKELKTVDDADHDFSNGSHAKAAGEIILEWMQKHKK
jgi:alpha-beta hydrolase superfamily lysophospholipase